jgi:hypothetical protein
VGKGFGRSQCLDERTVRWQQGLFRIRVRDNRFRVPRLTHKHQCAQQPHQNGEPVWAIKLVSDELGELGRDICHRIFCSVQAASRAEQRADFAESVIRRVVHDGNEPVTR